MGTVNQELQLAREQSKNIQQLLNVYYMPGVLWEYLTCIILFSTHTSALG